MNSSKYRPSPELQVLMNKLKKQQDYYNANRTEEQLINGWMNESLREVKEETGLEYKVIIKKWVNSMFPDMEVK